MQKMHIAFTLNLPFTKHIAYMPRNYRLIPLKQLHHLSLGQPYSLILQANIQPYGVIRPIHDYLVLFVHDISPV